MCALTENKGRRSGRTDMTQKASALGEMMQGNEACIALTPAPVIPGQLSFPTLKVKPYSLPDSSIFSLDQDLSMGNGG